MTYIQNKKIEEISNNLQKFKINKISCLFIASDFSKIGLYEGTTKNEMLEKMNIDCGGTKYNLIVYEVDDFIEGHYIFDEKISPIVGLITSKNIDYSIKIAQKILNNNGKGHSAGIYSENKKNIMKFSTHIPASRIIVNQPHSMSAGGSKNNYLKTTLSLGCGNWGGNILNDNLSLKDFCNITRIVYKKKKK